MPEEDVHNLDLMVVISHPFRHQAFGFDTHVIRKTINLKNYKERRIYRVIGVMPRGFQFQSSCHIRFPA